MKDEEDSEQSESDSDEDEESSEQSEPESDSDEDEEDSDEEQYEPPHKKAKADVDSTQDLLNTLKELCNKKEVGDVRIRIRTEETRHEGEEYLYGCSEILSACCPYFKCLLSGSFKEGVMKEVDLSAMEEAPTVLPIILEYIYTSKCNLSQRSRNAVATILLAADYLGLAKLADICLDWLEENVNEDNALPLLLKTSWCSKERGERPWHSCFVNLKDWSRRRRRNGRSCPNKL